VGGKRISEKGGEKKRGGERTLFPVFSLIFLCPGGPEVKGEGGKRGTSPFASFPNVDPLRFVPEFTCRRGKEVGERRGGGGGRKFLSILGEVGALFVQNGQFKKRRKRREKKLPSSISM